MNKAATVFTHAPRRPITPEESQHRMQRYYGADQKEGYSGVHANNEAMLVQLFRFADQDYAKLEILAAFGRMTAYLKPDALRELARRLIDAAHDIESNGTEAAP